MFLLCIYAAKYIFSQTTIVNSIRTGGYVLNKLELVNLPSPCKIYNNPRENGRHSLITMRPITTKAGNDLNINV